jgi:hypothetical protein
MIDRKGFFAGIPERSRMAGPKVAGAVAGMK